MSKFTCRICNKVLESERMLKKHARKKHDCSIFAAMNPSMVDGKPSKQDVAKVMKLDPKTNKHIPKENRYLVLYKGVWEGIEKIPAELQEYARSIAKTSDEMDTTPTKVIISKAGSTMTDNRDPKEIKVGTNENVTVVEPEKKPQRSAWKPIVISYSMVKNFLDCEQAWHYTYQEKIVPRVTNPKLEKGTLVHGALEAAWHAVHDIEFSKETRKQALKAARKAMMGAIEVRLDAYIENNRLLQEEVDAAAQVAQEALNVARKVFPPLYKRFKPLDIGGLPAVEYQFTIPVKRLAKFHGTIDMVAVERKTDLAWLIDWKVRGAFTPPENQEYNLQMATYQKALLELGVETAGSMTIEISETAPKEPELLKSKKELSRALIKTDWATYSAAIERHGFNEEDYLDMKEKLEAVEWVREGKAFRNTNEINRTWDNVMLPAIERMVKAVKDAEKGKFKPQRVICSLNTACPNCSYNQICMEELRGKNTETLREDFVPNTYLDKYEELA